MAFVPSSKAPATPPYGPYDGKPPKHLHVYNDRHGRQRIYFRRGGQSRVVLPGPLYSEQFWTAYHKAKEGVPAEPPSIGAERTKAGTMGALIAQYYKSAAFTGLADATRSTYRNQLEAFRVKHGDKPVAAIKTSHIDAILGEIAGKSTAQAHKLRKRLLMLMALAVKWEYRADNPMLTASKVKHKEIGYRTWTEDDIAAFRKRWAKNTPQRIALEVLLHTGLRRSDAVKLGRQHLQDGAFAISTKKSGMTVSLNIPLHPTLKAHLASLPKDRLTYIATQTGVGRSEKAFTNWIIEAAREAGLPPHSSPHGLRKATCRRLAEAGCSTAQIMAITGQSLSVVERYIRDFNRKMLAQSAMASIKDKIGGNKSKTKTG
ncbi:MAG: tyrosine-type recombinase/integrase [Xanthobacteraceae bacterium]|nr:tyrosine-type recombinase/integrase [Xanthobacteraceae bacterium]